MQGDLRSGHTLHQAHDESFAIGFRQVADQIERDQRPFGAVDCAAVMLRAGGELGAPPAIASAGKPVQPRTSAREIEFATRKGATYE